MFNPGMKRTAVLVAAIATFACSFTGANAAQSSATPVSDMGRLSAKGSQAFDEIQQARLAIFSGHPAQAKKLIKEAQASMTAAQADNTAFLKAESDLRTPPSITYQSSATKSTTPVSWLPVAADVTVTDDFAAKPSQAKAVASANEQLKRGKPDSAMKVLKLADVNVSYTMAVVPLKQTIADVDKAAGLLSMDKYYEANQTLKEVQDSVRYDWVDVKALPQPSHVVAKNDATGAASGTMAK
ncbi:YfdX family protein (plasmid) [Paraburkholderia sp. PREW-6R]|uniref:YfdX family protein n=1 Tax=Paraburkholderia sp. PREW-6R TaxID=3141544 RepID=UPI0031F5D66D